MINFILDDADKYVLEYMIGLIGQVPSGDAPVQRLRGVIRSIKYLRIRYSSLGLAEARDIVLQYEAEYTETH